MWTDRDHPLNAISLLEGKQAVFVRMKMNLGRVFPFRVYRYPREVPRGERDKLGPDPQPTFPPCTVSLQEKMKLSFIVHDSPALP